MTQITARHEDTVRGRIAWLESGAGWPVILLHAFPLDSGMWRPQLSRVPDGWHFIAPDLPGFGATPLAGRTGMDGYAQAVGDLMDVLGIDNAAIAGLSMGGYVAFAMWRQAPSRFSRLILADTRSQADTAEARASRQALRDLLAAKGTAALAEQMAQKQLSEHADPAVIAEVRRIIERTDPAAIDAALVAMMERPDSTPILPSISSAALVLVGELDRITPVADAEAMQRALPRSTMTVIPDAAHLANLEQPDAFTRALTDFLLVAL